MRRVIALALALFLLKPRARIRSIYALVLIALFCLQTVAPAAVPGQLSAPNARRLLPGIQNSIALVGGRADRYAEMHAAAPSPSPRRSPVALVAMHPKVIDYRSEPSRALSGVPRIVQGEPTRPVYPWQTSANVDAAFRIQKAAPLSNRPSKYLASARAMAVPTATPAPLTAPTTGLTGWWPYSKGTIPGVGRYLVNVGTGNLVAQAADIDVPERGVDLAFERTYNSQSVHDAVNDDASVQSNFGDGWTNSFDAHVGASGGMTSGVANVVSVYDVDGARYDYNLIAVGSGGNASWAPPSGMQGTTLTFDGSCAMYWTLKSGVQYDFWAPWATGCNKATDAGSFGRLIHIFGRDPNNSIHLVYSWANSNDSSSDNLSTIQVNHSDGQSITLQFATFANSIHPELARIVRPDGTTVDFHYDTTTGTHLTEVDQPGHGSGALISQYFYNSSWQLQNVCSPRYVYAVQNGTKDGGCTNFSFASNNINGVTNANDVTGAWNWVWANFAPNDNTNTPLQPNISCISRDSV